MADYKVLIPQPITKAGMDFLNEKGYRIVECSPDEQSIIDHIGDCDAVTSRTCLYTPAIIDAAPKLKVIANYGVGTDNIAVDYCDKKGIWVTNTPGVNAVSVAEHAMCLLLCAAKNSYKATRELRKGNWGVKDEVTGTEISGKTVGIIGLGHIGLAFAKMCHDGFGMRILGYDKFVSKEKYPDYIEVCDKMDNLISNSDIVSLHIPFIKENGVVMRQHEFDLMKPAAIFINTSRGENVDEQYLIRCLRDGKIRAAGLDVMAKEPIDMDNELLSLDNVILTPHHASLTYEGRDYMSMGVVKNIHAVLSGKGPINPVNHPEF